MHLYQARIYWTRWRAWLEIALFQAKSFAQDCIEDIPLLTRIAAHTGVLLLVALAVLAARISFNNLASQNELPGALASSDQPDTVGGPTDTDYVATNPIPVTNIPQRTRVDLVTYTVQSGDTVSGIADQFGVSADSILWANPKLEDNPDLLSLNQVLNIPPVTGVLYTVQTGDTLPKVVDKYKGAKTADTIIQATTNLDYNQAHHDLKAPDYALTVGQPLMIVGGSKPYATLVGRAGGTNVAVQVPRGRKRFGWPVSGRITQRFWARHPGVDLAAPLGTPVVAADSGTILHASWDTTGYGNMILINHGGGYLTRYGHLSQMLVQVGDVVKKGQLIGRVGSTGNSTGPHLHFEIIVNGVHLNPFSFLP